LGILGNGLVFNFKWYSDYRRLKHKDFIALRTTEFFSFAVVGDLELLLAMGAIVPHGSFL
jgi:hypothetical protein